MYIIISIFHFISVHLNKALNRVKKVNKVIISCEERKLMKTVSPTVKSSVKPPGQRTTMSFWITSMWGHRCVNGQQLALFSSRKSGFRNVLSGLSTLLSFFCCTETMLWPSRAARLRFQNGGNEGSERLLFPLYTQGGVNPVTKTWRGRDEDTGAFQLIYMHESKPFTHWTHRH